MKRHLLYILPCLIGCFAAPAHANWQYPGTYIGDGWYTDDGGRFILSARGGASYSMAKMKNDVGALTTAYYYDPDSDFLFTAENCGVSGCEGYKYAGLADIGKLPVRDNYSDFAVAGGVSVGWTIPNAPQWRVEAGWDHIAETQYNANPLLDGDLTLVGGEIPGFTVNIQSGGVHSTVSTDIISAMAFYDFFTGVQKPVHKMIPYVGLGLGYADTKTKLNLSDTYGDLSSSLEFRQYGELEIYTDTDGNVIDIVRFYPSEKRSSNVAGVMALGFSYGLNETMFLDFGARVMYVPQIKWALTNENDTRSRDLFSAKNLIYTNVMLGIRFEF